MDIADSVAVNDTYTMSIVNMATNENLQVQFQPEEFDEQIGVTHAEMTVPGLSHKVLQYVNTETVKYSFSLAYHARGDGSTKDQLDRLMGARRFLYALTHPRKIGGTPRVLFIWPDLISLSCVVSSLGFKYTAFNRQRTPIAFAARVELKEIRDVHVTMEDILANATGTQRSNSGPTGNDFEV